MFEREAILYDKLSENRVQCNVCPKRCIMKLGETGSCYARRNVDGKLVAYFEVLAAALPGKVDAYTIHFHPGKYFLSSLTPFCNFRCDFCAIKSLSFLTELGEVVDYDLPHLSFFNLNIGRDGKSAVWEGAPRFYYVSPENCCKIAIKSDCIGIVYNAAEPTIYIEWVLETCKEVHKRNGLNAIETVGYLTPEAAEMLAPHLDAASIGLKNCGSSETYKRQFGVSDLTPIYETLKRFREEGVLVEIHSTITEKSREKLHSNFRKLGQWVYENLGDDVPITASTNIYQKFSPSFLLELSPIAKEIGLKYFYPIAAGESSIPTYCPRCGTEVVSRWISNFLIQIIRVNMNLEDGHCPECGERIPIIYE